MNLNALEKEKEILKLKNRLLTGEEERLKGENLLSIDKVREQLNIYVSKD